MTLVTPETQSSATEELLQKYLNSVRDLRTVIDGLSTRAADGEDVDLALAQKLVSPSEALLKTCMKLEANLADQKHKELGIAQGGYALDLDQARFEIGCRLARLRACCGAGEVFE